MIQQLLDVVRRETIHRLLSLRVQTVHDQLLQELVRAQRIVDLLIELEQRLGEVALLGDAELLLG